MATESSVNSANRYLMRTKSSTFRFEIDYSKAKNLPTGKFISSPKFTAGCYDWSLQYYPRGYMSEKQGSHVSVYLCLQSDAQGIAVEHSFELIDKHGMFKTVCGYRIDNFARKKEVWGYAKFIEREAIKQHYCVNDVFVIGCTITVLTEPKIQTSLDATTALSYPGGLCEHIEKLWKKGERFDVTFEVEGESICAHRFMLAARSPVFEAQLFGPMTECKKERILINEMNAEVFKVLLHFIYTDQLAIDESTEHGTLSIELLHNLFVAADRYSLDKLTVLCEEQLEKNFSVDMVMTTLLLADQHSCTGLKQKCLEFIASHKNFSQVALTKGYLNIMLGSPSLLAELSEVVDCWSHFAKKPRIVWD